MESTVLMLKSEQRVRLTVKAIILTTLLAGIVCLVAIGLLLLIKEADFGYKIVPCAIAEIFFSVFGVLYAIVVGLLIIDALRRLRDMSATIQDEVNTIEDVWECIRYIDDTGDNQTYKEKMVEALQRYVGSVIKKEWDDMKNVKKRKLEREMPPSLTDVMENIGKIRTDGGRNFIAVQALIGKMADLTSHRSKRRELALQVFHHPLHILIRFMSVVITVGFLFLNVERLSVHIFIVCAIVVSLIWLHVVIRDLDDPYGGYWAIDKDPFLQVKKMLEGRKGGNGQAL